MNALSINSHATQPTPECVPDNVTIDGDDGIVGTLGFGGYTWEGQQALWPDPSDVLLPDDFDLAAIPPIEIGTTLPDQPPGGYDREETPYASDPNAYSEPGSGQDPFASIWSYNGMTW
jgi:hypothetical protein